MDCGFKYRVDVIKDDKYKSWFWICLEIFVDNVNRYHSKSFQNTSTFDQKEWKTHIETKLVDFLLDWGAELENGEVFKAMECFCIKSDYEYILRNVEYEMEYWVGSG